MERLNLKPTHKAVQNYYQALKEFESLGVSHEGAVRSAFQSLLEDSGRRFRWKLVPEWMRRDKTRSTRIDGALVDEYRLPHGFWEAKEPTTTAFLQRRAAQLSIAVFPGTLS